MYMLFLPFVMSVMISYLMTPVAIRVAHAVGAIDVPKDERRVHSKPIPRLGGLAIFIAFMATYLAFNSMSGIKEMGLVAGALIIVVTGVFDDMKPISAKLKLAAQIAAALVLFFSGTRIDFLTNYFGASEMIYVGMLSLPITIFWIVGITNTVNLIDGLDGLAAGISIIAASSLAYVAIVNGRVETALVTVLIVGSCLGFLPYNFNPAKIFMGDTGSLFLGFMLAATSIDGSIKGATFLVFAAPILALGLPIFDTTFAILRRFLSGRPIMEADKGHLHHRLLSLGYHQRTVVLAMYFISVLLGLSGIFLIQGAIGSMTVALAAAVLLILIPIRRSISRERLSVEESEENLWKE
ncbi:MAG: undecaprenyl/decaprenyl-phosphate alpha-N-acetylglucosaminyl 1-phosphate transferase [Acidaminobacter sp.]|nr:undecaprenyl/decaprenyl-phosphate alpha-N-acetylglucosaminyl 1-phosphate transferase [Acidaminobacter sp.]